MESVTISNAKVKAKVVIGLRPAGWLTVIWPGMFLNNAVFLALSLMSGADGFAAAMFLVSIVMVPISMKSVERLVGAIASDQATELGQQAYDMGRSSKETP